MKTIRLRKRAGFTTFGMRILYFILYFFFHCRAPLSEELKSSDEPVVFVANHYNIFGPLSFLHSVALKYSTWMSTDIISPETAQKQAEPGLRAMLPFLGDRAILRLCKWAGYLTCTVQTKFPHVPVDRNRPGSLLTTMRGSLAAMEKGDSLLIFPETGQPQYSLTSVTPFFSGFATIGQVYYRKTKRNLRFVPCYVDAQHRIIRFGESVPYRGEAPVGSNESERVSEELNRRMRHMAAAARGEGKEKSSPRSRLALRLLNGLRLGLLPPLYILLSRGELTASGVLVLCLSALRIAFDAVASRTCVATCGVDFLLSRALTAAANIRLTLLLHSTGFASPVLLWAVILHSAVLLLLPLLARLRKRGWAGACHADRVADAWMGLLRAAGLLIPAAVSPLRGVLTVPALLMLILSGCKSVEYQLRIFGIRREATA